MSITNDSSAAPGATSPLPDAHGQAALLLVESLIHGLLERSIITLSDAIEIVGIAEDVQVDVAVAADGHGAPMWRSQMLLTTILESLKVDDDGQDPTPNPSMR